MKRASRYFMWREINALRLPSARQRFQSSDGPKAFGFWKSRNAFIMIIRHERCDVQSAGRPSTFKDAAWCTKSAGKLLHSWTCRRSWGLVFEEKHLRKFILTFLRSSNMTPKCQLIQSKRIGQGFAHTSLHWNAIFQIWLVRERASRADQPGMLVYLRWRAHDWAFWGFCALWYGRKKMRRRWFKKR